MQKEKILIQLKSRKWVYFSPPVVYSVLRDALFRVSSSWRNFISYESFVGPFSFFLWKLMINFRQILLFLVCNEWTWSSLCCITLNARVYSFTLVFTSTGNGKTPPISLAYPKGLLKTSSEEWSMILHTISDNFVVLKHRRPKGNGKKSNTNHVRLTYGHT